MFSDRGLETIETKIELAQAFSVEMQFLSRRDFIAVQDAIGYHSWRGVNAADCPSRKYVDSDKLMVAAWKSCIDLPPFNPKNEVHVSLRNDAWRIAQAAGFNL
jgi:hypothetical protein